MHAVHSLYSNVPGGKKLCVPKMSSSFQWNASEVISTAAQGSLYIMAEISPLTCPATDKQVCLFIKYLYN